MTQNSNRATGGQLLAETLARAGVRQVFALHGGHLEAFYRGCLDQKISLTDFRHEGAAGHAADGFARATGGLGVCVITAGPGFANAIASITNAYLDAIPVLFIIGGPPLREAETNPLQGGFDQIAVVTPITKWAHRITNTERIPDITAMAIRRANTGRKGPVLLELPIDVLHMDVDRKFATSPTGIDVNPRPAPSSSDVEQLHHMLRSAERPAIIIGDAARFSGCEEEVQRLAESSGIPVFALKCGMGILPSDHPQDAHEAGNLAVMSAMKKQVPDFVLLLGTRLGLLLGGRSGMIVPHGAKVAQVYPDASEIGRIRDIDLPISADVKETLSALLKVAGSTPWPDRQEWCSQATSIKNVRVAGYEETDTGGRVHPYHAAAAAVKAAGRDAVFVLDGGESAFWGGHCVRVEKPGRVLGNGYLGCLGTGTGMSMGAQIAHPDRRVLLITGDGAAGFYLQEFDSMMRHGLPIVTVIFNNGVWGTSIHGQQIMYGKDYHVISTLGQTPYANVAASFGCYAERVERFEDVGPAVERAFASGKPACIEVIVDPDAVHPGTVAMLGQVSDPSKEVLIPYYENVPRNV